LLNCPTILICFLPFIYSISLIHSQELLEAMDKCVRLLHKIPISTAHQVVNTCAGLVRASVAAGGAPSASLRRLNDSLQALMTKAMQAITAASRSSGTPFSSFYQSLAQAAVLAKHAIDSEASKSLVAGAAAFEAGKGAGAGSVEAEAPPPVIIESPHPYPDASETFTPVEVPGAIGYEIVFASECRTESSCDYVRLFKDDSHNEVWGEDRYHGRDGYQNWAGCDGRPALEIPSARFVVHFHSDGSCNDWGYKITAKPIFPGMLEKRQKAELARLERLNGSLVTLLSSHPLASQSFHSVDDQLLQFIQVTNSTKFAGTSAADCLAKSWSEYALFANDFVQYSSLAALVSTEMAQVAEADIEPRVPACDDTVLVGSKVRLRRDRVAFERAFEGSSYRWDDAMQAIVGTQQVVVDRPSAGIFGLPECTAGSGQPVWWYPISVIEHVITEDVGEVLYYMLFGLLRVSHFPLIHTFMHAYSFFLCLWKKKVSFL